MEYISAKKEQKITYRLKIQSFLGAGELEVLHIT
jgi:hypothetical protein